MSKSTCKPIRIGCAGWNIGRDVLDRFPAEGSHLQRYSQQLSAVEINSSFYRPHRPATYRRWKVETPPDFRFSVKAPRRITHELRLSGVDDLLREFLDEVENLGPKLGVLLIQLPPSLALDVKTAAACFATLRTLTTTPAVCEPRHASWFSPAADVLLRDHDLGRVAADPAAIPAAAEPGGSPRLAYFRLHGTPRMYYSEYSDEYLNVLAERLRTESRSAETWCVFDNTAAGAAPRNALDVSAAVLRGSRRYGTKGPP